MILLDTNVILGFLHPDSKERAIVRRQLKQIKRGPFLLTPPVLHEVMNFVTSPRYIEKLLKLIDELKIEWIDHGPAVPWRDVVTWLLRYSDHEPDFVDGYLAVLSGIDHRLKIWSNDREFRTIWRRLDGSPILMAVKAG